MPSPDPVLNPRIRLDFDNDGEDATGQFVFGLYNRDHVVANHHV